MNQGHDNREVLSYYWLLYLWCVVVCPLVPYFVYRSIRKHAKLSSDARLRWHSLHAVWLSSMVLVFFIFFGILALILDVTVLWHVWTVLYFLCILYCWLSLYQAVRGRRFCLPFLCRWLPGDE